jgi:hypothetical protein
MSTVEMDITYIISYGEGQGSRSLEGRSVSRARIRLCGLPWSFEDGKAMIVL